MKKIIISALAGALCMFLVILLIATLSEKKEPELTADEILERFENALGDECAPFIFRFVLTQIGRLLKLPNGLRLELLLCARGTIYSDSVTLIVTTVSVLLLIFVCYRMFSKRIERSIWNVE